MKKYEVTITRQYEKTISVNANCAIEAKEKIENVLTDTDLIKFFDEEICSENVSVFDENGNMVIDNDNDYDDCSECIYCCQVCNECIYDEDCID